jgi:methyl-accepting chemotaxis protein
MNKKASLSTKVKLLSGGFIVFFLFSMGVLNYSVQRTVVQESIDTSKKLVYSAYAIFNQYDELVKSKSLTLEEAQKKAAQTIKNLQHDSNEGVWIHDKSAKMIVEPNLSGYAGRDMSGYRDSHGKQVFVDMVTLCEKNGEGHIDYYFQKPGTDQSVKRFAYVKIFEPWGWILGTGFSLDDIIKGVAQTRNIALWLIALFTVTAGFVFFWLGRSVSKPVNKATQGLAQISLELHSAAEQFSESSQVLAQTSSEQAASLEETSSSLEELASMTKQNADNSSQADILMKEASRVIKEAETWMLELTRSMSDITRSSEEISVINKTIDEIAFQTNLLALNAAVEAARAGVAGAGFAVVADEVRNLAMRSTTASKSTADLIETTVGKITAGAELMHRTNQAFGDVSEKSSRVAQLVAEIAAATQEQAQGITQVSKVVAEMDRVTQSNSANAEESASGSEEIKYKADQMKRFIDELRNMVGMKRN